MSRRGYSATGNVFFPLLNLNFPLCKANKRRSAGVGKTVLTCVMGPSVYFVVRPVTN